jgi:hypothetical protein
MSNNSIRQTVINNVQNLVKADKAFENGDNKQSVARYDLAVALAIFASRTKPSLVINNEDKKAWSKEFGLDALSKSSRAKVTQISYNPETLKIAKDSEDVAECKAKLDKQFSTFKTKELKDGKTETSKDVDATTFRGLAKALPKQAQDKPDLENKLNQESEGATKIFFRILRKLSKCSTSQLLEIEANLDGQKPVKEDEMHIPNPATIERFDKSLPSTVSNWMK